jgi:arabinofuranosyltransferase
VSRFHGRKLRKGGRPLLILLIVGIFALVLLRSAWLADDAFITFRTVANFADGHGLTWNVGERVQAYTNPLWLFLVSAGYFYTGEFYFTALVLSIALSVLCVTVLATGISRSLGAGLLGITILSFSKAFVDYSTSGLENPLTHLLLVLFCLVLLGGQVDRRRLFLLSLIAALGVLNRMDAGLFFLPGLLMAFWTTGHPAPGADQQASPLRPVPDVIRRAVPVRTALGAVGLGFVPFLLWELFSVLYYGFLFPNTAYAKLGNGLGQGELLAQGFLYLYESLTTDPLTLLAIVAGLAIPLFVREWRVAAIASGVALSLLYVIAIGGDFMSGRFLAAPLLGGVILLSLSPLGSRRKILIPAFLAVILIGLAAPNSPILSGPGYGGNYAEQKEKVDRTGNSDERAFYYPATGLLRAEWEYPSPSPRHVWVHAALQAREQAPTVVVRDSVGFYGLYAGPEVHVIDLHGLGDAFLARIPPVRRPEWRVGHFPRAIPEGYVETIATGGNQLADPELAAYYDHLAVIIRGPIFSRDRFAAIIKMNLGFYDALIEEEGRALQIR